MVVPIEEISAPMTEGAKKHTQGSLCQGSAPKPAIPSDRYPLRAGNDATKRKGCAIKSALMTSITPITTTTELADACARLSHHPFVTVDTEFLRESTYFPRLCVLQMASTDDAFVVDALADGIDLQPFFELMAHKEAVKLFHAAPQDVEIVWHRAGLIPEPI